MVKNFFLMEIGIRSIKWDGKNKFQSHQQEICIEKRNI